MLRIKNKNLLISCLRYLTFGLLFGLLLLFSTSEIAVAQSGSGKRPIIIIPGITGSQIVSGETGKTVWFSFGFSRDEPDDLRLPMSPNLRQNTDTLIAKHIIREVKLPGVLKI